MIPSEPAKNSKNTAAYRAGMHTARAAKSSKRAVATARADTQSVAGDVSMGLRLAANNSLRGLSESANSGSAKSKEAARTVKSKSVNAARLAKNGLKEGVKSAKLAAEKMSAREAEAGRQISAMAGEAMMAKVLSTSNEAKAVAGEHRKQRRLHPNFKNPLSKLLEFSRSRTVRGAALAGLALVTTATSSERVPTNHKDTAPIAAAAPTATPRPRHSAPSPASSPSLSYSLPSTEWSAPRAEDRVTVNAPSTPNLVSIPLVDRIARQQDAARQAEAARYSQFEVNRANNLSDLSITPPTASPSILDSYQGWGEQAEINRLAAEATQQFEMNQYWAERAERIGMLQPGQQIGTIKLIQTGESDDPLAPQGKHIVEHAIRVGYYDANSLSGEIPTASEVDGGMKKALNQGAAIHTYGGFVPGIDQLSRFNQQPTILGLHHLTPVQDSAFPEQTEGFRWPEKTKIANPETGERGDILMMTVGETEVVYQAIAQRLIDTTVEGNQQEAELAFGTDEFGPEILRIYNCSQSAEELENALPGTIPAADHRYMVYFAPIATIDLATTSAIQNRYN